MRHSHISAINHAHAAGTGILHAQWAENTILEQLRIGVSQLSGQHITYGGVEDILITEAPANGARSAQILGSTQKFRVGKAGFEQIIVGVMRQSTGMREHIAHSQLIASVIFQAKARQIAT